MASGNNDPKLLYAVDGIKAYHIANGTEHPLTPSGPQTLSLLMVPTASGFADPSGIGSGEEDFYLHLHLPPELDLPMPATTQIYHQPPTSYLIPRWDLSPDTGAFTRIEFPAVGSRPGIQEDVDTFETILAQCTAFLERAPPPKSNRSETAPVSGASAKAMEARGEEPPPYNPADYTQGEGYVPGSLSSSGKGGRIVLVDEEDGSVIGELSEGFQVVEDSGIKPGSKDGSQAINIQPAPAYGEQIHPAYKKSTIFNMGMRASRLLITTSDYVSHALQGQADNFTKNTRPVAKPVTFTPTTHAHIRKINQFSNKAAGLSAATVGSIAKVAQNFGANLSRRKDGKARGYDGDGNVVETYKPGVLNKSLMAFNTVVDGMEQAGRSLLTNTSSSVSQVVEHRWGPEAGQVSRNLGGGFKNVGLVYIDVTGVSRRAILKSVAKGMVVGNVKGGGQVIVGGDEKSKTGPSTGGRGGGDGEKNQYGESSSVSGDYQSSGKKPASMLHEILLSLSGHPSPLLHAPSSPEADALAGITPPERQLLSFARHISDLNINLIAYSTELSTTHSSTICRAVATAISSVHLAAFQRKVLQVEESILRNDADFVGAYNIVPLTAVMGEFQQWTRRLEWLWDTVQFIMAKNKDGSSCRGSTLIDRLRDELQSGYQDIADSAESLVKVAETAWLKQAAAWVLYGRLPSFGSDDFFDYVCVENCLPSFVTGATAASMIFIGKSLNHVRAMNDTGASPGGVAHVSAKLQELSTLTLPLENSEFSKAIRAIRISLSQNTLQKMLPLAKVSEMFQLLRDFFLLGRGEFAMALTHEADEKSRNRWRRAGNLAHDKVDGLKNITVKDGEVAAVLNRTWAVLVSMQGQHAEEDDQLELARSLIQLHIITKSNPPAALVTGRGLDVQAANVLATSPFRNMLFSVPAMLSLDLPSPLDMVISPSDLQLYSSVNAYLLSLRRAHVRLTELWKITSLRRHFPSPRGASDHAVTLRERWSDRAWLLRGTWTTASAAIFFLAETEAYFQTEIVKTLWQNFHAWLAPSQPPRSGLATPVDHHHQSQPPSQQPHDPQTLSDAHTFYLRTLAHRLLLTQQPFTDHLYALLQHIDHLVTHVHRLHSIFTSLDLEHDAGVVDAFVDLEREQSQVFTSLHTIQLKVRQSIDKVVSALRNLENDAAFLAEWDGQGLVDDENDERAYMPCRVGGVDRLLMKLDFGSWLGGAACEE
ncbi:Spc97/Spc98 family protein [Metarhizium album ARSEF 1941]|uniref:Spc97/Spc98 family protein n=1 Tax=Metarhizium album (strain ARSEF 1941) TaxID=1081103 RepID=A0A0B2X257_METAS|nr:Spc97/Spc98 family protein [Metarhizium album ARSEF 1941]KHN99792.1 Spc97/Spc98 family protein [Metarhizium album ARSEF 1941]